jgi:hypothetical protein
MRQTRTYTRAGIRSYTYSSRGSSLTCAFEPLISTVHSIAALHRDVVIVAPHLSSPNGLLATACGTGERAEGVRGLGVRTGAGVGSGSDES